MKTSFLTGFFLLMLTLASPIVWAVDTMIVVVRHAEKANDDAKDPNLSEQGMARANKLAAALKDTEIKAIYATQYKRTQQTAQPVASLDGLQVQVREANSQNGKNYVADLVADIKKKHSGETVLIVGHSNTVPEIVKYLTGKDIAPIAENEYDRIYVITLGKKTKLLAMTYHP
jgi:broad specificity phosphatase PhoE